MKDKRQRMSVSYLPYMAASDPNLYAYIMNAVTANQQNAYNLQAAGPQISAPLGLGSPLGGAFGAPLGAGLRTQAAAGAYPAYAALAAQMAVAQMAAAAAAATAVTPPPLQTPAAPATAAGLGLANRGVSDLKPPPPPPFPMFSPSTGLASPPVAMEVSPRLTSPTSTEYKVTLPRPLTTSPAPPPPLTSRQGPVAKTLFQPYNINA